MSKMTTYEMKDGSLIYGEYTFVTDLEFFDDILDPLEIIKKEWVLVEEAEGDIIPPHHLCPECHGEGLVGEVDEEVDCKFCGGDGSHPKEGQIIWKTDEASN